MSCVKVLAYNFLDPESLISESASSANPTYPVTNLRLTKRRGQVWRSRGYWLVESGSNTIVFRETVGVDLTATVTAGEYSSTTAFLAAIKTALDAAGDSTYTVSVDATTGKLKIASNGGGGGGILQLMWLSATAIGTMMGFDVTANDTGALTYTADLLRITTGERIIWDLGFASNPSAFAAVGLRNSAFQISPNVTPKLQGNETNVWSGPSFETSLDWSERGLLTYQSGGLHTEPLRYWSLSLPDLDNPDGYVEISKAFLGEYFEPTRGAVQFPFQSEHRDHSLTTVSESGAILGVTRPHSQTFNLEWNALTKSEVEELSDIFERQGLTKPFFIAMDPDAAFSSSAEYLLRLVQFADDASFELVSPNFFTFSMPLRECL